MSEKEKAKNKHRTETFKLIPLLKYINSDLKIIAIFHYTYLPSLFYL